jgi:hypothetical protein
MTLRALISGPLAAIVLITTDALGAGFSFQDKPGEALDLLKDGRIVARYMYGYDTSSKERREETYKPYLHVFDAAGEKPITKGPGGSFPHHRGIFVGWNKLTVDGKSYDRWHMKGGDQVHKMFLEQKADASGATFTSLIEWAGATAEPILVEERTMRFSPATAPAYVTIDLTTKLKAVGGETVLNGDPEHSGIQFRPAADVKLAETVYLLPKESPDPKKDRDYPWFAENFSLGDKRFAVVYLNHPQNPKDTAVSAYRDYGRFGAFFKDTIPANGEKVLKVRFVVGEGELPDAAAIQKLWNEFAGASEPAPKAKLVPVAKPKAPAKEAPAKVPAGQ